MNKEKLKKIIGMKKRDSVYIVVFVAIVIIASSCLVFGEKNADSTYVTQDILKVETKEIVFEDAGGKVSLSGVIQSSSDISVSAKTSGNLVEKYVEEGDYVTSGQSIMQLEKDQALLVSYNNAVNNLVNTTSAVNQDVNSARLAVATAENYLDNVKITTSESIKNAELSVQSSEIQLEQAKNAMDNSGDSSSESLKDAYVNMLNTMQSSLDYSRTSLTVMGDILGEYPGSNNASSSYKNLLGAMNSKTYYDMENSFFEARDMYYEEVDSFEQISIASEYEKIDTEAEKVSLVLDSVKRALGDSRLMLDNTITDTNFSYTNLTSLKSTVDQNLANINTVSGTLDSKIQIVSSSKIAQNSSNDTASNNYKIAQKSLDIAKQSLTLAESQQKTQIDSAEKQLESAKSTFESVQKSATLQIEAAQGQVNSIEAQIDNTLIKSPIDGVVSEIYVSQGELVSSGKVVVKVLNPDSLEVEVKVSEFEVSKIKVGDFVNIESSLYPDEIFEGEVYYVSSVADGSNKFPVKIIVKNNNEKIKSGMSVNLVFAVNVQKDVVLIPKHSVFDSGDSRNVYVVKDGKIIIRMVELEEFDEENYVVTNGLTEGEKIVINGNYILQNGDIVEEK